jgi:hypothetical protein
MTDDSYRRIFYPSKAEVIAGYEKMIKQKEEEIEVWRAYVRKLKGQATLNEVGA